MSSRHLIDPELLKLLDTIPSFELSENYLPTLRAMTLPVSVDSQAADVTSMTTRTVPGPDSAPDVGITIYTPRQASGPFPCIFHIHGGGFLSGSALAGDPIHRSLAASAQAVIVSTDYRLAPETPFPGAIEDCYAALTWVVAQAGSLGIDASRIGVMGESAGGGLAAALALLTRDRGEHELAFQHLNYPMLDDRTCVRASPHPYTGEFLWTLQNNTFAWSALLGRPPGAEGVSPYAAPARAEDLSGLPPAFIATGALDLFVEEDIVYAQRLMRQGVQVELHVYPGAFHSFDLAPRSQIAHNARRDSLSALKRALHPSRSAPGTEPPGTGDEG